MLNKTAVPIPFTQGLDTKTDPWQVSLGKFLSLKNTVFAKQGLLQKSNGFAQVTTPPSPSNAVTTYNGNLTTIGSAVNVYSSDNQSWVSRGTYQPCSLSTVPLIRNSENQIQVDAAVAQNGFVCAVYAENNFVTTSFKFAVADSLIGQNIIAPTLFPEAVVGYPQVVAIGSHFVIAFLTTGNVLQYFSISSSTLIVSSTGTLSAGTVVAWDMTVANALVIIGTTSASVVSLFGFTESQISTGSPPGISTLVGTNVGDGLSLGVDSFVSATPTIWLAISNKSSGSCWIAAISYAFNNVLNQTAFSSGATTTNMTVTAWNQTATILWQLPTTISQAIQKTTVTQAGSFTSIVVAVNQIGIASKAFVYNGLVYVLAAIGQNAAGGYISNQPTYFLINISQSTAAKPSPVAKIAYSNGGGLLLYNLPRVSLFNGLFIVPYLYRFTETSNGGTIFFQTGINLVSFNLAPSRYSFLELAGTLAIGGGFQWMFDGLSLVEQNFFLYPDYVSGAATSGGGMGAGTYQYQVCYEWIDNQGNIQRSAPAYAFTSGGSNQIIVDGTTNKSVQLTYSMLSITYKTSTPVSIVFYRSSNHQATFYAIKSTAVAPLVNDPTQVIANITDSASDAAILGNAILYTTGGVVEDTNGPASNIMTIWDTRQWLLNQEDQNSLWFSKQVIEATPVEMSGLFTQYIAPTTGLSNSSGPVTASFPMDDKIILFKKDAIYYINGVGPDNTGANSQYSQPIFVTATVGCANQNSIVFFPGGLLFQSDKGIWLLDRGMSVSYIGAAVEAFNQYVVTSAVTIPTTNQVRFTLNNGICLMYDFYYQQWGEFDNISAISSCIYQGLHTFLTGAGLILQETPGSYFNNSVPVVMSFVTSWLNLAGLQGYQRAYFFFLLGQYFSPHTLSISIAYDYETSPTQSTIITPDNASTGSSVEQWRVFLDRQRCQAFQITLQEIAGSPAGQGLSLSGINLVVAMKKGWKPISAAHSTS